MKNQDATWLARLAAWDEALSARIALAEEKHSWRSLPFWLAHLGAHLGDSLLWTGITAWLWRRAEGDRRRQRTLLLWMLSVVAALLSTLAIKRMFRRERPGQGRFLHGTGADLHSFPSGHGARVGVILVWAETLWPGAGRLAPLLGLWIGWGRVAVGVHHLGDVLAGVLLGLGLGRLFRSFTRRRRSRPPGQ